MSLPGHFIVRGSTAELNENAIFIIDIIIYLHKVQTNLRSNANARIQLNKNKLNK